MSSLQKYLYILIALLFFGVGVYAWKIVNTGLYIAEDEEGIHRSSFTEIRNLVYVGDVPITQEDIDWEVSLHTLELVNTEELTPIPEIPGNEEHLKSLRERLIADLIERKLLYQFIEKDINFNLSDPSRYTSCLAKWQEAVEAKPDFFQLQQNSMRLKNLLCERDVIMQYLEERVFARIEVSDQEIEQYYKNHAQEFDEPRRVVIRQIVLASEREAKRVRSKITSYNFEELAKEYSIAPEAENGGKLGPFAKGEMPPVFDVAFSMRRSEVRGILKSTYGFHLIKLIEKLPARKLTLEEARPNIVETLKQEKQEKEYQKWVELALNEITVKTPHPI